MRIVVAIGLICSACLSGCASETPLAPTRDTPAAVSSHLGTLNVLVLDRDSQQPIAGAAVLSPTMATVTDQDGACTLSISIGEEIEVLVSAAGYESMAADAAPGSHERWTFYLQFRNGVSGSLPARSQVWSRDREERGIHVSPR